MKMFKDLFATIGHLAKIGEETAAQMEMDEYGRFFSFGRDQIDNQNATNQWMNQWNNQWKNQWKNLWKNQRNNQNIIDQLVKTEYKYRPGALAWHYELMDLVNNMSDNQKESTE